VRVSSFPAPAPVKLRSGALPRIDVRTIVILLAVAAWTVFVGYRAWHQQVLSAKTILPVPGGLLALVILRQETRTAAVGWALGWTALIAAAVLLPNQIATQPLIAFAPAGLAGLAFVAARRPTLTVVAIAVLAGGYSSIQASTGVATRSLCDALLAALLCALVWNIALEGRRQRTLIGGALALLAVYVALTLFAVPLAATMTVGFQSFRSSAWYMLAFLILVFSPWSSATRVRMAKGIVLVGIVVAAYAIYRWRAGATIQEQLLQLGSNNVVNGKQLPFAPFISHAELAIWCAQMIPFCAALALGFRGRWRAVSALACGACAVALFAADNRTGVAAVIGGILLVLVLHQTARAFIRTRIGTTAIAVVALAGLLAGTFALVLGGSSSTSSRYSALLSPGQDPSFQARQYNWTVAYKDIDTHPFGQGLGTAGDVAQRYSQIQTLGARNNLDNSLAKIALEQGFAVLILFAAAILALLYGIARRAVTVTDRTAAALGIGACGTLLAFIITMPVQLSIEGFGALSAWIIVGIGAGHVGSVHEPRPSASAPPGLQSEQLLSPASAPLA